MSPSTELIVLSVLERQLPRRHPALVQLFGKYTLRSIGYAREGRHHVLEVRQRTAFRVATPAWQALLTTGSPCIDIGRNRGRGREFPMRQN